MVDAVTPDDPAGTATASGGIAATPAIREGRTTLHRRASVGRWRFVRAYATTFTVIASYMWFAWRARLFGQAWREARVSDLHMRNARRVYATILRLQGLFIKVGQLLSIMANFLPAEFRAELEALQDQVPPRPYAEIAERLQSELGANMSLIAALDHQPMASASLGQVHGARLVDGRRVAVKVQHRDIDRTVRLDLGTIRRILLRQ